MEKEDNYMSPSMNEMNYSTMSNTHQQIMAMTDSPFSASQQERYSSLGNDQFYMLKFPVLNDDLNCEPCTLGKDQSHHNNSGKSKGISSSSSSKRKRARIVKTTEEVESQKRIHIAVERNRRKQMNEHLRVLRTLMPSSYVQRGDQASIIGGAIEFVRELEQLLQCLESQKRRKLYEGGALPLENVQPFGLNNANDDNQVMNMMPSLHEESGQSKSSIADVEVKLLGFEAFIKILSRRRPAQLIKTISALQDLHFNILHTNITTIQQTVLYSFNVQISSGETRFNAEDIAGSVQQIFTFIHATTTI